MDKLTHFLNAAMPVLLAVLPSLIVAFTNYPKTDGALKRVLKVLNALSVLTHFDSPNMFKMPLTQSKNPNEKEGK